jgi:predicted RNase H-like HicB family nuclease
VPALRGCNSFGETIEEARVNIAEAIELHVEGLIENGAWS